MPKTPRHTLVWSDERQRYELQSPEQPVQPFQLGDNPAFSRWLDTHTSFAFVEHSGRRSILKEARPRGTGYWYAYHKQGRRTRKRYLGPADQVTFACLEQEAHVLTSQPASASFASEIVFCNASPECYGYHSTRDMIYLGYEQRLPREQSPIN